MEYRDIIEPCGIQNMGTITQSGTGSVLSIINGYHSPLKHEYIQKSLYYMY